MNSDSTSCATLPVEGVAAKVTDRARSSRLKIPSFERMRQVGFSLSDQGFAVAGGFLANVALARSQTKEEYGIFALWYSVFTFLLGLYYAVVLEPCTVHGSGRYRERFSEYLRLVLRLNAILCALLTGILLLACLLLSWVAPRLMSRSLLGLALTAGVLLSAYLLRRLFYVQREPGFAAKSSLVFFITLAVELWLLTKSHHINSLTVFVAMALGWIAAGAAFGRRLQFGASAKSFLLAEPNYLSEHWKYSKWVLATAFVFQFTHQGYYWLVGLFLSAAEVANLRALYLLVGPIEQVFIAFSYLIVPALSASYAAKRMGDFFSTWRKYALVTAAVSVIYIVFTRILGSTVVHIVYGGRYDGLAPYLFVLALVPMVLWIGTTMGHALNAAERPKFQFWAYVSSAIATFVLGIPLVIHFGLWGAVYGMLVSSGTYTVALAVSFLLNFWSPFSRRADLA